MRACSQPAASSIAPSCACAAGKCCTCRAPGVGGGPGDRRTNSSGHYGFAIIPDGVVVAIPVAAART
eukprot:13054445-Alexandrium_andersonii.AAC.1